jgi:hypothetical protein
VAFLPTEDPPDVIYQAIIDDGYYLSLREESLKRMIDASRGRKKRGDEEGRNASLLLNPGPEKAAAGLRLWLEWETHRRALANNGVWEALLTGGVVRARAGQTEREEAAFRLLGYVPVSPDGSAYAVDGRTGAVSNLRHGTLRNWRLHTDLEERSPLRGLLGQIGTVRTDLRFREDGIHTVLRLDRLAAK